MAAVLSPSLERADRRRQELLRRENRALLSLAGALHHLVSCYLESGRDRRDKVREAEGDRFWLRATRYCIVLYSLGGTDGGGGREKLLGTAVADCCARGRTSCCSWPISPLFRDIDQAKVGQANLTFPFGHAHKQLNTCRALRSIGVGRTDTA